MIKHFKYLLILFLFVTVSCKQKKSKNQAIEIATIDSNRVSFSKDTIRMHYRGKLVHEVSLQDRFHCFFDPKDSMYILNSKQAYDYHGRARSYSSVNLACQNSPQIAIQKHSEGHYLINNYQLSDLCEDQSNVDSYSTKMSGNLNYYTADHQKVSFDKTYVYGQFLANYLIAYYQKGKDNIDRTTHFDIYQIGSSPILLASQQLECFESIDIQEAKENHIYSINNFKTAIKSKSNWTLLNTQCLGINQPSYLEIEEDSILSITQLPINDDYLFLKKRNNKQLLYKEEKISYSTIKIWNLSLKDMAGNQFQKQFIEVNNTHCFLVNGDLLEKIEDVKENVNLHDYLDNEYYHYTNKSELIYEDLVL